MADLIDQDHTSQTQYEAITRAAAVAVADATRQDLAAGRLWEADGASLLAAAYAFHSGVPRQAATAGYVRAMRESSSVPGPPSKRERLAHESPAAARAQPRPSGPGR
jgi:hypothetical protein